MLTFLTNLVTLWRCCTLCKNLPNGKCSGSNNRLIDTFLANLTRHTFRHVDWSDLGHGDVLLEMLTCCVMFAYIYHMPNSLDAISSISWKHNASVLYLYMMTLINLPQCFGLHTRRYLGEGGEMTKYHHSLKRDECFSSETKNCNCSSFISFPKIIDTNS